MGNWERVKHIFEISLDKGADERQSFIDQACSGDEDLRREVDSLLAHEENAARFMNEHALDVAAKNLNASPAASLIGRILNHYKVVSLLGAGGMGEVYLAEDTRLDRNVAIKTLPVDLATDPDRMLRFIREAKAGSALNHPNIAIIHDIGESEGLHFIVMEYVEGRTLAETIGGRPMDFTTIVDVGLQVAGALDAAHAKGIIHRDIKPANLMITPRGQVKVLDFGIAKMNRRRNGSSVATTNLGTTPGLLIGSGPYLSPEQVLGREADTRSDIFSLGVSLYEMATGRLPFQGSTTMEMLDQVLHGEPESMARFNDKISAELEQIIHKCLEKDAALRYQSAHALNIDLLKLSQNQESEPSRASQRTAGRHNLPVQLTSFIGRQEDVAEIRRLSSSTRALTLTGAGGCGKTRLALEVAAQISGQFEDGVWLVDLSSLSEPDLITQTVAVTLGVREGPNHTLDEALADYFRRRHLLLVLDNCEHLIPACAPLVETLLRAASNLHILATSREALGIKGEAVWRVPSMSLPSSSERPSPEMPLQYEAIRLFVERAGAVDSSFTITEKNTPMIVDVCRRLDGIPLAIELAVARLNILSVEQINSRLKDRFRLLTGGSRTAVARQRTLEATLDWSYDLLSEPERILLCRLSVFPGGWTLETAEEVCSGNGIDKESIIDLLSHLVDKSLVQIDDTHGHRRYRFLETVRQYGRERLLRAGDSERMRDRHLEFFSALVQRAEPELIRAEQVKWLNRLQVECDNLRSALDWCLEDSRHGATALELTAVLWWFWIKHGYLGEGRQWSERALAVDDEASGAWRAKATFGLSLMRFFQGDYSAAATSVKLSLALSREVNDQGLVALSLGLKAYLAMENGDVAGMIQLANEGRAAALASGELWHQGPSLSCLAHAALGEGNLDQACRLTEEALDAFRQIGDKWGMGQHICDLALFRALDGRYSETHTICVEGITIFEELGDRLGGACCIGTLAAVYSVQGQGERAVRLWGALEGLLESVGAPLQSIYSGFRDRYVYSLKESLGQDVFHTALSEGRAMSFAQAIQYALQKLTAR